MNLQSLGWDETLAEAFLPYEQDGLVPGRAAVEHRIDYVVYTELGELRVETTGKLRHDGEHAAVGDWLAVAARPDEGKGTIHAVLPRRSAFIRKTAFNETKPQVLAANVDVVFIVAGLDNDFNVRRIERYLTLGWESGAQPVVLLTKADLCADVDARLVEVEAVAFGVAVHAVAALRGDGVETVRSYIPPGRTAALLGSSGVGKSTLVNALVGHQLLATQPVRESDSEGRHTTTHRELVLLPDGGLVLDTPGMRELQLWDADEGIVATFDDVEELTTQCRFTDCGHRDEPDCAVRQAIEEGTLDESRFLSWQKLQRELEHLALKQDARGRSEIRKERRRFARSRRKSTY